MTCWCRWIAGKGLEAVVPSTSVDKNVTVPWLRALTIEQVSGPGVLRMTSRRFQDWWGMKAGIGSMRVGS